MNQVMITRLVLAALAIGMLGVCTAELYRDLRNPYWRSDISLIRHR